MTRRRNLFLMTFLFGCTTAPGPDTAPVPENRLPLTREAAAEILDLYLAAYETPISQGGGRADALAWWTAADRELQYDTSSFTGGSLATVAHNALDYAFGFDFQHPRALESNLCVEPERDARSGNIRLIPDPSAGLALLAAVRASLKQGILKNDAGQVKVALDPFWSGTYWNYVPAHTGRCYPHGHLGMESVTPSECVVGELERLVRLVENRRTFVSSRSGRLTSYVSCECYYSPDCGDGNICNVATGCVEDGKLDGNCEPEEM